jgi:hypothetical protein
MVRHRPSGPATGAKRSGDQRAEDGIMSVTWRKWVESGDCIGIAPSFPNDGYQFWGARAPSN